MPETDVQKITIDGKEYALDSLSEDAKAQIFNLQTVDRKIGELQQETGIMQTARASYVAALKEALPED